MYDASLYLRTEIQDQRHPGWTRRGSRYWTQAELHSDIVFYVEQCPLALATSPPKRFVTADISEAVKIPAQYGLEESKLFACILGPPESRRIEQVTEAYAGASSDQVVVKLSSGLVVFVHCTPPKDWTQPGTPVLNT